MVVGAALALGWAATRAAVGFPASAWLVGFSPGGVSAFFKNNLIHVRAVRGGL